MKVINLKRKIKNETTERERELKTTMKAPYESRLPLKLHLFKTYFNIILPSVSTSFRWSLVFWFPENTSV
jgi:hypothetical protein